MLESDSPVVSGDRTTLFGTYEIGRLLGVGASAKVYQARDLRTGKYVAVKAVSKQKLLKGTGQAALVKREIAIMRRLNHPHIVKLLEVLATKSKIYFVMEFARGGELFSRVEKGRFSEDLCRRYFQQLIAAVEYCHSRGVFHRDLKLENLLLDENLDLKVSDFGLSAVTEQIRPDGLLHTLCGTPAYVAPEILAKKGYDGTKVDVWSCGVILYVLNAGYLPFNDTNLLAMYKKIYRGEYRCPKWTSPDLKRFLSRLLDANPETRITIDEIKRDPWFRKGYRDTRSVELDDPDWKKHRVEGESAKHLSAFDIISLSPGFDLSGLFQDSDVSVMKERFVSAETPETIIKKFEETAKNEKLTVTKNDNWFLKLVGVNGCVVLDVAIYRLTEKLVMVEIRTRQKDDGSSHDSWKDKLRPKLIDLIHEPGTIDSGN